MWFVGAVSSNLVFRLCLHVVGYFLYIVGRKKQLQLPTIVPFPPAGGSTDLNLKLKKVCVCVCVYVFVCPDSPSVIVF